MPRPSAPKTASAAAADCVSAKPSAAPMNGAVQGLAQSPPARRREGIEPGCSPASSSDDGASCPTSNAPIRLEPDQEEDHPAPTTPGSAARSPAGALPAPFSASSAPCQREEGEHHTHGVHAVLAHLSGAARRTTGMLRKRENLQ